MPYSGLLSFLIPDQRIVTDAAHALDSMLKKKEETTKALPPSSAQASNNGFTSRWESATPFERDVYQKTGMEPGLKRKSILPWFYPDQGLTAPQMLYDAVQGIVAPSAAASGKLTGMEEMIDAAGKTTGVLAGGGLGGGAVAGQSGPVLGLFAGQNAKTADLKALEVAKKMLAEGASPASVWKITGWGLAPDGNWKFEIPDNRMKFLRPYARRTDTPEYKQAQQEYSDLAKRGVDVPGIGYVFPDELKPKRKEISDRIDNLLETIPPGLYDSPRENEFKNLVRLPGLIKAYPDKFGHMRIFPENGAPGGSILASYDKGGSGWVDSQRNYHKADVIHVMPGIFENGPEQMNKSLLHESQHAIQDIEGWQGGGNRRMFEDDTGLYQGINEIAGRIIKRKYPSLQEGSPDFSNKQATEAEELIKYLTLAGGGKDLPYSMYARLGGEAEARLVSARSSMSPAKRRASYPWDDVTFQRDTGVPVNELIYNMSPDKPSALDVYHGSPYKFDRFDASNIGKGEGSQAYGYGHYLAEEPKVAETYSQSIRPLSPPNINEFDVVQNRDRKVGQAFQYQKIGGRYYKGNFPIEEDEYTRAFKQAKKNYDAIQGNLYKVDLPDDQIPQMLNYDGILSEQPQAIQDLAKLWGMKPKGTGDIFGHDIYGEAVKRFGGDKGAADALSERGVPGIRYLDGFSRKAGDGTRNFVVFPKNENLLKILERNGQKVK